MRLVQWSFVTRFLFFVRMMELFALKCLIKQIILIGIEWYTCTRYLDVTKLTTWYASTVFRRTKVCIFDFSCVLLYSDRVGLLRSADDIVRGAKVPCSESLKLQSRSFYDTIKVSIPNTSPILSMPFGMFVKILCYEIPTLGSPVL